MVNWAFKNGAKETRTPDPLHAMQVLYQLSYGPIVNRFAFQTWLLTESYYTRGSASPEHAQTWRQTATSLPCTCT